jgi:hypothetical protein
MNLTRHTLLRSQRSVALALLLASTAMSLAARETANLDGAWQIVFDHKNEGRTAGWYRQQTFEALAGGKTIQVPNCWETIEKDYEGVGWYGRRFSVPASWKDDEVRVHFGAVNYRAEVWVNDQPAGFHEGGYTPFVLRIGDLLKPGAENFIAMRVIGPIITKDTVLDGIGPNELPHWRGAIAGGIWQAVDLIATSPEYLSGVFVEPDIHASRASVHVEVVNSRAASAKATLEFAVAGTVGAARQELTLRPGKNLVQVDVPVPNAQLWTPDSPHLYTLATRLLVSEHLTDAVEQRFGMREFTMRGASYYLNGKKIYLKAGFWEGLYPTTLAFPANADIVRREIRLAKEAGFNMLRPWRKPPAPMILDLADELGMMTIGAPAVECLGYWPQLGPETEHRIAIEMSEMVERDRNHPSVVYWQLFDEVVRPGIARLKQPMSLLARDLDPTRIVVDQGGGGSAAAYPPYGYEAQAFNEMHSFLPAPVRQSTYDFYQRLGVPGSPGRTKLRVPDGLLFLSEVGYGGLPNLPANMEQYKREGNPLTPDYRYHQSLLESIEKAASAMHWDQIFPDTTALCLASQRVQAEGNRLQLEALRLNPRLAGYSIHAYTDGDWVIGSGVLDLFRNPKLVYETVKRVQSPLYLAVQVNPRNFSEGQSAQLRIRAINENDARSGRLEWEIAGPDGQVVQRGQKELSIAGGIGTLLEMPAPALGKSGTYHVRVRFGDFANDHEFFYLTKKDLEPPTVPFTVLDPKKEITPFLEGRGIPFREFTGKENSPVVVASAAPQDAATFRRFVVLMDYVERGGVAVFLKAPGVPDAGPPSAKTPPPPTPENPLLRSGLFPFQTSLRPAHGNWIPVNHGVRPHPIFEGLPSKDFMGQTYLNTCASETILGIAEPPIVGSLTYDWRPFGLGRNYTGPGGAWWGSDLVAVPYGKGHMLLSTLHVAENLGKDPVADKLLYNMVRWAASTSGRVEPAGPALERKLRKYNAEFEPAAGRAN